jgi:hypothetical protein
MWGADGNERSASFGEDRGSDDLPMTLARREAQPGQREPGGAPAGRVPSFRREFREPVGYERGLVVKAVLAVVLVAIIVTLRALYLT